jgi:hypothetical protein
MFSFYSFSYVSWLLLSSNTCPRGKACQWQLTILEYLRKKYMKLMCIYRKVMSKHLSLSLSHTHTHTHTHSMLVGHSLAFLWISDWLERTLSEAKPVPKVVTVVNPGNPSGTYIPDPLLKVLSLWKMILFMRWEYFFLILLLLNFSNYC